MIILDCPVIQVIQKNRIQLKNKKLETIKNIYFTLKLEYEHVVDKLIQEARKSGLTVEKLIYLADAETLNLEDEHVVDKRIDKAKEAKDLL